jgi:hypothetical protein
MDIYNVWTVATKDFSVLKMKKSILFALVTFPLIIGIDLPAIIWLVGIRNPSVSFDPIPIFLTHSPSFSSL